MSTITPVKIPLPEIEEELELEEWEWWALELTRRAWVGMGCPVIYPDNDKDPMPLEPEVEANAG